MKLQDESTGEVLVGRDLAGCYVEIRFAGGSSAAPRVARLTSEEARRLAALILFQSARLERSRTIRAVPSAGVSMKMSSC